MKKERYQIFMTHVCCPKCGHRLMNGNDGNNITTKCSNCKNEVTATFNDEEIQLVFSRWKFDNAVTLVCCPKCGHKLLDGINGNNVNIKCPKCKAEATVSFNGEKMRIVFKAFNKITLNKALAKLI